MSLDKVNSPLPILVKIYSDIYFNTQDIEHAVEFFEGLGILPQLLLYKKCDSPMRKSKDHSRKNNQKWACTSKSTCGYRQTIRSETCVTIQSMVDWYNFCRDICYIILINQSDKIGSKGKVVEIDESKFDKHKYNREKRVEEEYVEKGNTIYSNFWATYQIEEFEKHR
ncbi:11627_t:CDS:2 [Gigaspora margarita]|uniref:11627_t:CDS:1 n=1 Tax=Gigaspora margarita TaxID=4874 RepID=A0ABM8VWX2_GIGMA|nr:11627_t:CDS:2 [Gigaspora margarita]